MAIAQSVVVGTSRLRFAKAQPVPPYDFAPPPLDKALRSNRMSPAGVVMFYGSDDAKTAQLEINDDPKLGIAVGTFRQPRYSLHFGAGGRHPHRVKLEPIQSSPH